jgi:hypothetical protein
VSETNAQTKTSDQGLLAAGFFVGLTPLYYAKINRPTPPENCSAKTSGLCVRAPVICLNFTLSSNTSIERFVEKGSEGMFA